MGARHPNHALVKIHRSYAVEEMASLLGVHKNTIRNWLKQGLEPIDAQRRIVVCGEALRDFLVARRQLHRRPCGPGKVYCLRCREPRVPRGKTVVYVPSCADRGSLVGQCPECLGRLVRRTSRESMATALGNLSVALEQASPHIGESPSPCLNCDIGAGELTHA